MMSGNSVYVLVVDLDGSLINSDMLYETFWSAVAKNWLCIFGAMLSLFNGKAALKCYLSRHANVDVSSLPYNQEVIAYVRRHRAQGGRCVLATASNQAVALEIAQFLQIFDEVYGSSGSYNLRGSSKASLLSERFNDVGFIYVGDSRADFPVWRASRKVVTVNGGSSIRKRAEQIGKPWEHLGSEKIRIYPYIQALRPHQWLKNALIFLPMIAGQQVDAKTVLNSIMAFAAFSLVASSVYVLNDLLDLNSDRAHPRKRLRPFASGNVAIAHGTVLALALLTAGALIAALLDWMFLLTVAAYYVLTTAYSLSFKRHVIIDIFVLAGLYTMRILAGGVATGIQLSVWLFAFAIFFFFSLAAVKRQAELVDMVERGTLTTKGRGYHVEDLPVISMIGLAAGYISVLVMALYINSPAVQELYGLPEVLWGICCILLYWLTRMVLLTHRGAMHDDPVVFAATDRVSQVCFLAMLAFAVGGAVL